MGTKRKTRKRAKRGGGIRLYHGSPNLLKSIEPRKPRGTNNWNSQEGVYLTDNKAEAQLYSLARDSGRKNRGFAIVGDMLYLREDLWLGESPKYKLNDIGYLYIIDTDEAIKNPIKSSEYLVKSVVIPKSVEPVFASDPDIQTHIRYVDRATLYAL
jgi:hypothetical protein